MPPKPVAGGASIRGKQAAVHEGQFLQFLRSVGYRDELPPSTVAWLESAPVFRFLASKLSHDNFITPEEEQEYNELLLARGPDASLYDAVEGYGSDTDDDSSIAAGASTRGQKESDPFLAQLSDEEVSRLLEEEEAYGQQLEQQIAVLRAASGAMEATTRQQAEAQGPMYFTLTAQAADELSAAKLDAQQLADTLDATLADLEAVCSELCALANQPHLWLLCAADPSSFRVTNDHINEQHYRGVHVLDVADVALDLHHPESPAAAAAAGNRQALAAAARATALLPSAGGAAGGYSTPRGGKQSLAEALQEAKDKRRAAHSERNNALTREMARQQHAFLLAYQRDVAAGLREQGVKAQLSAAQQVRSHSGEFAALLGRGAAAVQELQQQVQDTDAAILLLKQRSLKPLMQEVAALNDGHIVVGDYDRHLAKVNYAMDRKRAMLESLMGRASLHLVLLLLCVEELRRLAVLSGQLQGTATLLEDKVAATEARLHRCGAALEALEKAQALSNVQADDSYLCALLAAADGTLALTGDQQQQQHAAAGAAAALGDPHTPRDAGVTHSRLAGGMFTPSYAPTSRLLESLQRLGDSLDGGTEQLHKLLDLLPAQLDQHKASACRLHRTAFPPGQPLQGVGGACPAGGAGPGHHTGTSSVAGSVAGSVRGSAAGGGGSTRGSVAAASGRTEGGSLSGAGGLAVQHPQLLLTLPEVAEASAAVKGCLDQLLGDTNRAITRQNDAVKKGRTREKALEREVMAKFFNRPAELAADVDAVRAAVQRLTLDQALGL